VVEVTGISVEERVLGSTGWSAPDDGNLLWGMDEHRWTADIAPNEAQPYIMEVEWFARPWADPNAPLTEFTSVSSGGESFPYAYGRPNAGEWAIIPKVKFPHECTAETTGNDRYAVISVSSVEWTGYVWYADDEDNLFPPNQSHDDYRFFAEQNHPDEYKDANGTTQPVADHELHNMVNVHVSLTSAIPAGMTGTLHLRVYDPDNLILDGPTDTADDGDPNSFESDGLYEPNDNQDSGLGMSPARPEITFGTGEINCERTFTIPNGKRQPGNNYIVAASSNMPAPNEYYHFRDDDGFTLYYNEQQSGSGGSGGGTVPIDLPWNLRTSELTVWRTLWTELDSMAAPGEGDGPFGSTQPQPDDQSFDPHNPDISFLTSQMGGACVQVQTLPATYDTRDDLAFQHNFAMAGSTGVTAGVRDVESESDFWSAHIVGVYEADQDWDYDSETQWHIGQSNKPIIIYEEVIRDLSENYPNHRSQGEIEGHVVLHEVLHRFYGPHSTATTRQTNLTMMGNMDPETTVTRTDATNALSRLQLSEIQLEENPGF
jgi:hypothetical protein